MKRKKVLIVCNSGLGTSLFIRMLVEKFFRKHNIHVFVENADVTSSSFHSADLYIGAKQITDTLHVEGAPVIALKYITDEKHVEEELTKHELVSKWIQDV